MKKLIHQYITTGAVLPEHQFKQLSNNQAKSYLNIRVRSKRLADYELVKLNEVGRSTVDSLIDDEYFLTRGASRQGHLLSDEQHLRIIKMKINDEFPLTYNELFNYYDTPQVENYLSTVTLTGALFLLEKKPKDHDKLIKMLLNNKGFSTNIGSDTVYDFIRFAENKELIVNLLLKRPNIIPYIQGELLNEILEMEYFSDKESLINTLLNNSVFRDNLRPRTIGVLSRHMDKEPEEMLSALGDKINVGIFYYLEKSLEPKEIFDMVGSENVKNFIPYTLAKGDFIASDSRVSWLLHFATEKEEIVKLLLSYEEFTDNLKLHHLNDILFRFQYYEDALIRIYKILLNNEQIMSNLTPKGANLLVQRSNTKTNEMVRVALKKYGLGGALINMEK